MKPQLGYEATTGRAGQLFFLIQFSTFPEISSKLVHKFLSYVANKYTDKQTNAAKNITWMIVEVMNDYWEWVCTAV